MRCAKCVKRPTCTRSDIDCILRVSTHNALRTMHGVLSPPPSLRREAVKSNFLHSGLLQHGRAFPAGAAAGQNVIDKKHRIESGAVARRKRTLQVVQTFLMREPHLRSCRLGSPEHVLANQFNGHRLAKKNGLIESPHRFPAPVDRHRKNRIDLQQTPFFGAASHELGHPFRQRGDSLVFKTLHAPRPDPRVIE